MYYTNNGNGFKRGVWVNGDHYPQETTFDTVGSETLPGFTSFRDVNENNPSALSIGTLRDGWTATECNGIQIYSFRVWHRQLNENEITTIYNQGPQVMSFQDNPNQSHNLNQSPNQSPNQNPNQSHNQNQNPNPNPNPSQH